MHPRTELFLMFCPKCQQCPCLDLFPFTDNCAIQSDVRAVTLDPKPMLEQTGQRKTSLELGVLWVSEVEQSCWGQ